MSSQDLYKQVKITPSQKPQPIVKQANYRGISTVNPDNNGWTLYDIALIKQDLINHFHIRQGEKLSDPEFGTIIWDILFEPLTDDIKNAIIDNVTKIASSDPRLTVNNITVDQYESGIQVELSLLYLPYNISEQLRFEFDQNNGFVTA